MLNLVIVDIFALNLRLLKNLTSTFVGNKSILNIMSTIKKAIFFLLFTGLFSVSISAQNKNTDVNVGSVFTIGEVEQDNYKYINFPKANFVIKKGGIVNYNLIRGKKVEVTSVKKKEKGTLATIKLVSGKRFFGSHKYVTVYIDKAIESNELQSK